MFSLLISKPQGFKNKMMSEHIMYVIESFKSYSMFSRCQLVLEAKRTHMQQLQPRHNLQHHSHQHLHHRLPLLAALKTSRALHHHQSLDYLDEKANRQKPHWQTAQSANVIKIRIFTAVLCVCVKQQIVLTVILMTVCVPYTQKIAFFLIRCEWVS